MKFELKNIKYSAFASEETHCFSATVYKDGKRWCIASNQGYGGCTDFQPFDLKKTNSQLWKEIKTINKELNTEIIDCGDFTLKNDLELVVGDLMNDFLANKELKKLLRRVTYSHDDKIYQLEARVKPTPKNLELVKRAPWWKDNYILINELPTTEAIKLIS